MLYIFIEIIIRTFIYFLSIYSKENTPIFPSSSIILTFVYLCNYYNILTSNFYYIMTIIKLNLQFHVNQLKISCYAYLIIYIFLW